MFRFIEWDPVPTLSPINHEWIGNIKEKHL